MDIAFGRDLTVEKEIEGEERKVVAGPLRRPIHAASAAGRQPRRGPQLFF
jgi:hypothetical protein